MSRLLTLKIRRRIFSNSSLEGVVAQNDVSDSGAVKYRLLGVVSNNETKTAGR